MENNQKLDSGFKLDVTADTSKQTTNIDAPEILPSSFIFKVNDVKAPDSHYYQFHSHEQLPQSALVEFQNSIQLPEQKLFNFKEEKIKVETQTSKSLLNEKNVQLKVNPEDALKKANQIGKNLDAVKKDLENLSQNMRYPDNRTNTRDNYDETVTIPAANTIFENRKTKMIKYPDWI